jgi:hypothetical protein
MAGGGIGDLGGALTASSGDVTGGLGAGDVSGAGADLSGLTGGGLDSLTGGGGFDPFGMGSGLSGGFPSSGDPFAGGFDPTGGLGGLGSGGNFFPGDSTGLMDQASNLGGQNDPTSPNYFSGGGSPGATPVQTTSVNPAQIPSGQVPLPTADPRTGLPAGPTGIGGGNVGPPSLNDPNATGTMTIPGVGTINVPPGSSAQGIGQVPAGASLFPNPAQADVMPPGAPQNWTTSQIGQAVGLPQGGPGAAAGASAAQAAPYQPPEAFASPAAPYGGGAGMESGTQATTGGPLATAPAAGGTGVPSPTNLGGPIDTGNDNIDTGEDTPVNQGQGQGGPGGGRDLNAPGTTPQQYAQWYQQQQQLGADMRGVPTPQQFAQQYNAGGGVQQGGRGQGAGQGGGGAGAGGQAGQLPQMFQNLLGMFARQLGTTPQALMSMMPPQMREAFQQFTNALGQGAPIDTSPRPPISGPDEESAPDRSVSAGPVSPGLQAQGADADQMPAGGPQNYTTADIARRLGLPAPTQTAASGTDTMDVPGVGTVTVPQGTGARPTVATATTDSAQASPEVPPTPRLNRAIQANQPGAAAAGKQPTTNQPDTTPSADQHAVPALRAARGRYNAELQANPGLKAKIMRIAANEQDGHPQGVQAVMESLFNRAGARGTSLAQAARWHGLESGGYYAPGTMGRGALENPRSRAILERAWNNVMGGSNISNYATDNSSGRLARNERATGKFRYASNYGGETFFTPGRAEPGLVPRYQTWRQRLSAGSPTLAGIQDNE